MITPEPALFDVRGGGRLAAEAARRSDVGLDVDDGGPDQLGHRLDDGRLFLQDLGLTAQWR